MFGYINYKFEFKEISVEEFALLFNVFNGFIKFGGTLLISLSYNSV